MKTIDDEGANRRWWATTTAAPDGTWNVYDSLAFREEDIIARCSTQRVAAWIASHCPAAMEKLEAWADDVQSSLGGMLGADRQQGPSIGEV